MCTVAAGSYGKIFNEKCKHKRIEIFRKIPTIEKICHLSICMKIVCCEVVAVSKGCQL